MSNVLTIIIIVAAIAWQEFSGRIGNRYLGAILPIIFAGFVFFFLFTGRLGFNFKDILMPFIGEIALIGTYESGKQSRKKKLDKELAKMKAKDISKN
ncbi:hypothetical protein [Granulicatella seriolae]|uniref:Holin n=1 Tax=Granulicatella seriolae TaxID=2967226 RepID=A0ABT1WPL7_9LACT|nr:hypothetical protein [Granulicatella seriolae]